ncbi:hypothetical protein Sjap_016051 [Stephania japonica]|uniref:Ubiquitin-like protease family profile domain-containing protein n=1 Tax=Stephania japonica TaxID=461633 RepID=A0AAP0IKB2_9MAGN
MEDKKMKKGPLEIDQSSWNTILNSKADSPPPEIEVIGRKQRHQKQQQQQHVPERVNDIELMSDYELKDKIKRLRQMTDGSLRLPDKGVKLLANLKLHEDESKRRIDERLKKDAECQPSAVSEINVSGQDNCIRSEITTTQASSPPSFAKCFYKKLEEKVDNGFVKEQNFCQRENNDREKTKVSFQRKEAKVYYPSRYQQRYDVILTNIWRRDDPECVELCHSDIGCLDPQAFLSSTIMNFYIRYLQRPISATGKSRSNYYFFNTYFYEKLKEAVTYKGDDEGTFYVKFRRWWKGIDIFQKPYILLPIHERQVSFLVKEWEYLKNQVDHTHPHIPENIWKRLSRRIEGKPIKVPQQRNDYDCGVFVLYYMERFIEEAPQRLRIGDLSNMFKRQWFKPEEASRLRGRIRKLLEEEFQNASIPDISRESSPASSDDSPQGCDEYGSDLKWTFVE